MNSKPKAELRVMKDGRVILGARLYQKMRLELCALADWKCEGYGCGINVPLTNGHADHVNGRGGGRRDDRIFVDGKRNLQWLCPQCHHGKHNPKAVPKKALPTDAELRTILGL